MLEGSHFIGVIVALVGSIGVALWLRGPGKRLAVGPRFASAALAAIVLVLGAAFGSGTRDSAVHSRSVMSRDMEAAFQTDRVLAARGASLERALTDDAFFERYRTTRNRSATFRPADLRDRFGLTLDLFEYRHKRNAIVALVTANQDDSASDFAQYVGNQFDRLTALALYDAATSDSDRLRIAVSFLPLADDEDKKHICPSRARATEPLAGYLTRVCGS